MGEHRGAPAFDHVGQQGLVHAAANLAHLFLALGRLHKQNVSPGACVGFGTAQGLVQAQAAARIGAGDDEEVGRLAAFHRHADLAHHVFHGDDPPAGGVPAFFGVLLVFELNGLRARSLVALYGVANIQQAAVACVAIGDERGARHACHGFDAAHHVRIGGQACVGQAQVRRDRAEAGHVQRIEPKGVRQPQGHHVVHARRRDQAGLGQALAQCAGRGSCGLGRSKVLGHEEKRKGCGGTGIGNVVSSPTHEPCQAWMGLETAF